MREWILAIFSRLPLAFARFQQDAAANDETDRPLQDFLPDNGEANRIDDTEQGVERPIPAPAPRDFFGWCPLL